jgi:hypothetical protein
MSGSRKSFSVFCKPACVPTSTLWAAETCFCLDQRKSDTRAGWSLAGHGRDLDGTAKRQIYLTSFTRSNNCHNELSFAREEGS